VKPEKIAIGHLGDINAPKAEHNQAICKQTRAGFSRWTGDSQP
jgi:hypothetical protein